MRVLFTGATSFTGMWFVKTLLEKGHGVIAVMRQAESAYSGLRKERLKQLGDDCEFAWNTPFGTPEFRDLIADRGPFDIFCHHAAEVTNYKSPDFDIVAALEANTHALPLVLSKLREAGCHRVVLTGSVFEADEGAGSTPLRAFSPYGLSKTLTAQVFRHYTEQRGMTLGKFVISNPFGPYEEPKFTEYLMRCWKEKNAARVNTPLYVRDNVPASLLAAAYCRFVTNPPEAEFIRFGPSYYVESQGEFATRFAGEIGRHLKIEVPLELAHQTAFPEPAVRINTDVLRATDYDWSEQDFWRDTAHYYANRLDIAVR